MTFDALPDGLEAELAALKPLRLTRPRHHRASSRSRRPEQRVLALVGELAARGRVLRRSRSAAPASKTSSSS